jgi:hypothetical protein
MLRATQRSDDPGILFRRADADAKDVHARPLRPEKSRTIEPVAQQSLQRGAASSSLQPAGSWPRWATPA